MPGPIAIPWVLPAVGEGLLYGAGALGTGLAALGIIENKDAIRNGVSDFGNWLSNGVQTGIKSASQAMSPSFSIQNPSVDQNTGRYIAVSDATSVQTPYPTVLLPQVLQTRREASKGTSRTRSKKPTTPTAESTTETPQPPKNENDPKRSLIRRGMQWVKENPKKSLTIGAVAVSNPSRKYVLGPLFNYTLPSAGNIATEFFAGKAPFNIPFVANDSTDLVYHGGTGIVKNPNLTRQGRSTDNQRTTIPETVPVLDTIRAVSRDSVPPVNSTINWSREQ